MSPFIVCIKKIPKEGLNDMKTALNQSKKK